MKFTAQEEYGLRCVLHLARTPQDGEVSVAEIAESEGISMQYVGKLLRILGKAGLLESVRGRKGGYRLARPADEISVAEILSALGGEIYGEDTCERFTGDRNSCVHTGDCSIRSLWSGLAHIVNDVLSRVSLRELAFGEEKVLQQIQVHTDEIGVLSPSLASRFEGTGDTEA